MYIYTYTYILKEAEIRQPWVVNGHNAHTPDSREACQAIAFYDNFTPEKSRPRQLLVLRETWIRNLWICLHYHALHCGWDWNDFTI